MKAARAYAASVGSAEARRVLVDGHMGLVRGIAAKVVKGLPATVEFDELVSLGTQGLLEAAERFDPKQGFQFSTFAYYRIRGAIGDGLRRMGWLSRTEYKRYRAQLAASDRGDEYLAEQAEREAARRASSGPAGGPAPEPVQDLAESLAGLAAIFVTSLEAYQEHGHEIADDKPDAAKLLTAAESQGLVRRALTALPEKERRMLEAHYFEDMSLKDAGETLGLSRSWASRLHARAVDLLALELARLETKPGVLPSKAAKASKTAKAAKPAAPAK